MSSREDWIRIELSPELMRTADAWGTMRNRRAQRARARSRLDYEEGRQRDIRGVRGEMAVRLWLGEDITEDDGWADDVRRGWDVGGYGVRCRAKPWYGLTLKPGEHGRFLLVLDHEAPVMWLVGWINADDGYRAAKARNDGDNQHGSRYWVVPQGSLHALPERNGARQGATWLVDPQTRFWCENCGQMHPLIEHRTCRVSA